jgi:hypothetical protein
MGKYDLWLEEWKKPTTLYEQTDEFGDCRGGRMAYACADLGDKEQTFLWLDKALADKAGGLEVVKIVPSLDPWRSDPRYLDLIKRMA